MYKSFLAAPLVLVLATPTLADITAEAFFEEFITRFEEQNGVVTVGSLEKTGNVLQARDIVVDLSDANTTIGMEIAWLDIVELPDGSTSMTVSPYTVTATQDTAGVPDIAMTLAHENMEWRASGTARNMQNTLAADQFTIVYKIGDFKVDIRLQDISSEWHQIRHETEGMAFEGNMSTGPIAIRAHSGDAAATTFSVAIDIERASSQYFANMLFGDDYMKMIERGGGFSLPVSFGKTDVSIQVENSDTAFALTGSQQNGRIEMQIEGDALSYGLHSTGVEGDIVSAGFAIPSVHVAFDTAELVALLPARKTDDGHYSFNTGITNLTLNEDVWALFDPERMISRAPVSFAVDIGGSMVFLMDIFDPESIEMSENMPNSPMRINSVHINKMLFEGAGAKLSIDGALRFNHDNTTLYDDFPQPIGRIFYDLEGSIGLVADLVKSGLIKQSAAMAARYMIATFATVEEGRDHFTAEAEFTPKGEILVNGLSFDLNKY